MSLLVHKAVPVPTPPESRFHMAGAGGVPVVTQLYAWLTMPDSAVVPF